MPAWRVTPGCGVGVRRLMIDKEWGHLREGQFEKPCSSAEVWKARELGQKER